MEGACWQPASTYVKDCCKEGENNPFSMAIVDRIKSSRLRLLHADLG